MIQKPSNPAIFYYAYHPAEEFRQDPRDGGFSFTLYTDRTLIISLLDDRNNPVGQSAFMVAQEIADGYQDLVDRNMYWLADTEGTVNLPAPRISRFTHRIGLPGMYFEMDDIAQLCHLPFNSAAGRAGRRMCGLCEDFALLMEPMGILFSLDGYTFNENAHPLRDELYDNVDQWSEKIPM